MPDRQAVDFLRRRYAAAILRDDADTACRLRSQLDRVMNQGPQPFERAPWIEIPPSQAAAPSPDGAVSRLVGRFQLRLLVSVPVTGLLEDRRPLPRATRALSAAADLNGSGVVGRPPGAHAQGPGPTEG